MSTPSKPDLVALAPCPFCGGEHLESGGDDKFVGVRCLDCEASGPNHYITGREWNARHLASQPSLYEAGLRDMRERSVPMAGDRPDGTRDTVRIYCTTCDKLLSEEPDTGRKPGPSEATAGSVREALVEARPYIESHATENGTVRDLLNRIDAALALSAPVEAPVAVKPLEWSQSPPPAHEHEPFVYWAAGVGGHYRADRDGLLWMAHDEFIWEKYADQKAAKAAAQADFEQRIRSALIATQRPLPSVDEGDQLARKLSEYFYVADGQSDAEWDAGMLDWHKDAYRKGATAILTLLGGSAR